MRVRVDKSSRSKVTGDVTIMLTLPKANVTKTTKYELADMEEAEEVELTFPPSGKAIMGSSDSANISHIRFLLEKIGEFVDTVEADMGPEIDEPTEIVEGTE